MCGAFLLLCTIMNRNNLRIVFVTNNYTPYCGGVVSSINATVQQLQKMGHIVFIVTLDFLGDNHADPDFVFRVPCPLKFMYKKNHMAAPWGAKKYMHTLIQKYKPDIIHVHHPFLLGKVALSVAKSYSIPVVFTYHTMYEKYVHYVPLPALLVRPVVIQQVLSFCEQVDAIIVPSFGIKHYLSEKNVSKKIAVIPSSVQPFFFSKTVQKKSLHNPIQLLTVSRFVPEKNIPVLFDVIAQLPQHKILFKLAGYGADYEKLQHYAYNVHGLSSDTVQFIHKPSKIMLKKLYKNAHLFLFSSQTDTQALVLAEAMAQSTPVIALDGHGQRDIIKQGNNGFIVENTQQMVKKVDQVINNATLYKTLQESAWRTAQRYKQNQVIKKLIAVYKTVKK